MIIRNPAIPGIDRFLKEIQDKIEILEQKNNLTPEEREELRALKSTHTTRAFFRLGEIMVKEPKNPIHLVITNPYHFAVALHFTSENIPICIAKGADLNALIIMKMTLEANIKVVEFKEVARAIYATAELYEPIENSMLNFLGEPNKDMSLYEAIGLAKNSDKLVSMEYVIKSMEEKNWEE